MWRTTNTPIEMRVMGGESLLKARVRLIGSDAEGLRGTRMKTIHFGLLIASMAAIGASGVAAADPASSYSKAVQQFCRADYKKYCGEYGLESTALRSCMDRNGSSLSKACVHALVQDGQVSQAEVNRRKQH
jgi:hypothetical protein